jgi:hypothetical protein
VLVMFGIVPNPTAAIAVSATNNPIANFSLNPSIIQYIYKFHIILLNYTFSDAIHYKYL